MRTIRSASINAKAIRALGKFEIFRIGREDKTEDIELNPIARFILGAPLYF